MATHGGNKNFESLIFFLISLMCLPYILDMAKNIQVINTYNDMHTFVTKVQ